MFTEFKMKLSHYKANFTLGKEILMHNKAELNTHNAVINVIEPWHRGSGFTWMLLALAGAVFFFSGAAAKAQTSWGTQINYGSGLQNASNSSLGQVSSLTVTGAKFNAWSDPGPWWNDSLLVYRVTGQNLGGGWSTAGLPRIGNSNNDVYFEASNLSINLLNGIDYRGTYTFEYKYEFKNNNGTYAPSGTFNPQFTVNNGNYYAAWNSGTGSQTEFNGGETTLQGTRSLVKVGAGTINLTGDNSYSGATTINAGALEVQHNNGLGTTAGSTTVNNGGQLRFYTGGSGLAVAEDITATGTGNGGVILSTGGNNSITGIVTLGGNARVGADTSGGAGSLTLGAVNGGNNVLYVGGSANVTISGVLSGNGNTDGTTTSLFKDGANTLTLSGNNSYTGDTRITQGALTVASGGNLGNGSDVFVSSNATLNINTSTTVASLQETAHNNGGVAAIGASATLTVNGANKGTNYMNSISGAGGLTMSGANSRLQLYGTQSYAGKTTVTAGTLAADTALASTDLEASGGTLESTGANKFSDDATITVNGGTLVTGGNDTIRRLNATSGTVNLTDDTLTVTGTGANKSTIGSSATATGGTITIEGELDYQASSGTSALSIASGGKLTGSGTTTGKLTVGTGGTLALGNSPGTLTVGSADWAANGRYDWEINSTGGTAGSSTGWDLLDVNGLLQIQSSSASPFVIALISLTSGNSAGLLADFNETSSYSFAIAYYDSLQGFNTNKLSIDTTGFANSFSGAWSLDTSAGTGAGGQNELLLRYTGAASAIPEPSSAALTLIGLGVLALRRRRR